MNEDAGVQIGRYSYCGYVEIMYAKAFEMK